MDDEVKRLGSNLKKIGTKFDVGKGDKIETPLTPKPKPDPPGGPGRGITPGPPKPRR